MQLGRTLLVLLVLVVCTLHLVREGERPVGNRAGLAQVRAWRTAINRTAIKSPVHAVDDRPDHADASIRTLGGLCREDLQFYFTRALHVEPRVTGPIVHGRHIFSEKPY